MIREYSNRVMQEDMEQLARNITELHDASIQKVLDWSHAKVFQSAFPTQPINQSIENFQWISLGSGGRYESTVYTDQDSALIYSLDSAVPAVDKQTDHLLDLYDVWMQEVSAQLNIAGYPPCQGFVM